MSYLKQIRKLQRLVGVKVDGIVGPVTVAAAIMAIEKERLPLEGEKVAPARTALGFVFDARTEKNLQTLHPKAQVKFRPFVARAQAVAAAMGCEYVGLSGHRSYAEQNELYAKGRSTKGPVVTRARGGQSDHNFGIAMDFGVFRAGRYLDGSKLPADRLLAEAVHRAVAEVMGRAMIWGGDWRRFKDLPHFEVKTDLGMAQKRARVEAGKSVI